MGRTREFSSEEKLKIKQVLLAPIPLPENKKFFWPLQMVLPRVLQRSYQVSKMGFTFSCLSLKKSVSGIFFFLNKSRSLFSAVKIFS